MSGKIPPQLPTCHLQWQRAQGFFAT
jgi:hypothetical protein